MLELFKTLSIFYTTLIYLFRSYQKNVSITQLKQEWALSILKKFNFEIEIKNRPQKVSHQILLGNHISYLDIIVLLAIHPETVFLAKKEVSHWPIIGAGAKRMGTLFVNRSCAKSRANAKTQIKKYFVDKETPIHLAGFPSGTTCLTESKPWKKGLFEIAQQSKTPIQPFRMTYSPLRECAYIDSDTLFISLMKLFNTPNKKIIFEWGEPFMVNELEAEMNQLQQWSAPLKINYENKIPSRPAYSFQVQ